MDRHAGSVRWLPLSHLRRGADCQPVRPSVPRGHGRSAASSSIPTPTVGGEAVIVHVTNEYAYHSELRTGPDALSIPLSTDDVTPALAELVEETYTRGLLAEQLPTELDELQIEIAPDWATEPTVDKVEVTLITGDNGQRRVVSHRFERGPWVRSAQRTVERLRAEGSLAENEQAYRLLVALKNGAGAARQLKLPPLQPPPIVEQSLEEFGVRQLGEGSLAPDRPVLINGRLVDEAIQLCEFAGVMETGGAVLGKIIRLPEPLPNTQTRVVTVLTAILTDFRHTGNMTRFHISPEALVEGAEIAAMRGMGESVLTLFHTHGWGCGDCNQKSCLLAECYPSLQDYELESLFPTKALLLPIAGRKQGAAGRRPILQIHAWLGGEMRPIRWQTYFD